jgi:hypothetical protein
MAAASSVDIDGHSERAPEKISQHVDGTGVLERETNGSDA